MPMNNLMIALLVAIGFIIIMILFVIIMGNNAHKKDDKIYSGMELQGVKK